MYHIVREEVIGMILIYTSFGCTSATKAKQWLAKNDMPFVEKNIQNTSLEKEEIKYLLQRCPNGTEDIISTRSKAYKMMEKDLDDYSTNDLVEFIQQNPTVLKRPIIVNQDHFVVGFDDDEITSFVPANLREYALNSDIEEEREEGYTDYLCEGEALAI